jgi:hypothetical protein
MASGTQTGGKHSKSFLSGIASVLFDESKHKRGAGGKFASKGLSKAPKQAGSVGQAHAIFDKMKGQPKADMLAAAKAAGINPNTAKTQLYHWQKKQAAAALGAGKTHTKEDLQAAAKALKDESHLKGYDHIVKGEGSLGDKMSAITSKYKSDLDKASGGAEFEKIKSNYEDAKSKLKASLASKKLETASSGDAPKKEPPSAWIKENYLETKSKSFMAELNQNEKTFISSFEAMHPEHKLHSFKEVTDAVKAASSKAALAPVVAPVLAGEKPDLAKLGPTKYVHALADYMPGKSKKEVMAAAVAAGVNKSTASVQYHKWAKVKAGDPPQLAKSPEPAALKAKEPSKMTDKELDKSLDSYHGKTDHKSEAVKYAPKPVNMDTDYSDSMGGKALTGKLHINSVYKIEGQGKTFYKGPAGGVYEHTGSEQSQMTLVAGSGPAVWYDPSTKVAYNKINDVLKPIPNVTTPVWKSQQPPPGENDHAFKDHPWATANGVQNPDSKGVTKTVLDAHAKAGVTYNETNPAVKSYTGSGYHAINGDLRASKGQVVGNQAKQIDNLIAKSSFKEETIMWRGVGSGGTVWNGSPPPAFVDDHGFTSVSFKPSVAKGFSDGKTIFRVRVPKGFPGLNVAIGSPGSGVAGLQGEAEVLLPRGTTYKVVERHKGAAAHNYSGGKMDVVDLEPVLPAWYIAQYGQPKLG